MNEYLKCGEANRHILLRVQSLVAWFNKYSYSSVSFCFFPCLTEVNFVFVPYVWKDARWNAIIYFLYHLSRELAGGGSQSKNLKHVVSISEKTLLHLTLWTELDVFLKKKLGPGFLQPQSSHREWLLKIYQSPFGLRKPLFKGSCFPSPCHFSCCKEHWEGNTSLVLLLCMHRIFLME